MTACTDDDIIGGENVPSADDHGIGQLVLFSSGNTANTTSRANVVPYMEQDGRFVCKMFYHAKATDTDASPFDTISTPITSWLRVNNDEGNSVYWRNDFDMDGVDTGHQDYLDYGFDSRAQYFYWRNRLDHIFLGYCDYNKLKTNTYGTQQGRLFMYPEYDGAKKTKTGEEAIFVGNSWRQLNFKPNPDYSEEAKLEAEANGETYDVPKILFAGISHTTTRPNAFYAPGIDYFYLGYQYIGNQEVRQATLTQIEELIGASNYSDDEKTAMYADLEHFGYSDPVTTSEGVFKNYMWYVRYDESKVDPVTHCIDLTDPSTVIFSDHDKQEIRDIISTAPANTFDLTRGNKTNMAEQPDPLIALTKMKPTGATQEANRVRLYFKHQFSQIQVNLTKAENTAEINAGNIESVELLGVSEKGYVFTNINPDGTQIPPTYDAVVISKYTEDQLKQNPFGTAFNMFEMDDDDKPLTSIKSFNAIAFGQLQAIRITWKEEPTGENYTEETAAEENARHLVNDASGKQPGADGYTTTYAAGYTPVSAGQEVPPVKHVATYKITVDDRGNSLVNLRSGYRYMYDFELRRGTIAFIRAEIVDWLLDDELDYNTSGTINE